MTVALLPWSGGLSRLRPAITRFACSRSGAVSLQFITMEPDAAMRLLADPRFGRNSFARAARRTDALKTLLKNGILGTLFAWGSRRRS